MNERLAKALGIIRTLPVYKGWTDAEISDNLNDVFRSGDPKRVGNAISVLSKLGVYEGWQPDEIQSNVMEVFGANPKQNLPKTSLVGTAANIFPQKLEEVLPATGTIRKGVSQLTSGQPVAGAINTVVGAGELAATPFSVAADVVGRIPYVGPAVTLPFRAVGEAVSAIAPPGENAGPITEALHSANQFGAQGLLGGGMAKMAPKIGPVKLPDMRNTRSTGAFSERIVPASDAIPVAFRSAMIKKLARAGERADVLNALPDAELVKIYKAQGLDAPASLSEAPVSRGGDLSVRGPANQAQITAYQGVKPKASEALVQQAQAIQPKALEEGVSRAFNINLDKVNLSPEGKSNLVRVTDALKPELQRVKGKKLTNAEVLEAAQTSDVLQRVIPRESTKKVTAALTRTRQEMAAGAEGRGISPEFIKDVQTVSSFAADAGRKLQAFNITADPTVGNVKASMVKKLIDLGIESQKIVDAAKDVDFTDARQAAKFYREFVKPSWGELVNEYRFINLLSSPSTHIVNSFNNMLRGGLEVPAMKLAAGGIDAVGSLLTGKPREYYARSVLPYYKGVANALPEASRQFMDAMSGKAFTVRPDLEHIPSMGQSATLAGKPLAMFNEKMQFITNALEANDRFFQTLVKGGEKESIAYEHMRSGKDLTPDVIDAESTLRAKKALFREELDPSNLTGQGKLLSHIDKLGNVAYKFREVPVIGWVVPFVRTPLNILKRGVEYTPGIGMANLKGNVAPTELLAKQAVGTAVFSGAAALVLNNDSTWEPPKSQNERERWQREGIQPYSMKIGDTWFSYSKLGPLAFPVGLAAAVKYHWNQSKQSKSTSTLEKLENVLMSQAQFFTDQSYVQGLGDLIDAARSGDAARVNKFLAGFPSQLVPLSSLQSWVGNITDPIYRRPSGFVETLALRSPFTRTLIDKTTVRPNVPVMDIPANIFNAFSPIRATTQEGDAPAYLRGIGSTGLPRTSRPSLPQ